jgi:gamma-glutamyltranspeptidase/glutathione hydrolase
MHVYSRAIPSVLFVIAFLPAIMLPASSLTGCKSSDTQQATTASAPPTNTYTQDDTHTVHARNGVVVSVSGPASDVGLDVLRRGGNAVDAAVATAIALNVTYPLAGNIGGGGFMLVHPAPGGGEPVAIDYRETAPAAATPTMFAKGESQYTHKASATPGTVRGLESAHRRFGSVPWADLIRPAIALARDGFAIDKNLADSMNVTLAASPELAEFQRVFRKPGGAPWQPGDRLVQPDLARTLQILAEHGPDGFYKGPIAKALVDEMVRGKGLITAADLAAYRAIERKPLVARFRDTYDVYVPPPPSSGGAVLVEELNMLAGFDLKSWGRWSPTTLHVLAEVMRRANVDRARYLGDPAFAELPAKLTDPAYARDLAATIDLRHATPSETLASDIRLTPEGPSTTQFSVIDRQGMAVSTTYTLERRWGSRIVVKDMGFILNNDMFAFNHFPGVTDTKGTIGTPPNTIAPGKRPLSSMTPTIVAKDGCVKVVTGSPGSRAIPHTVLCVLLNLLEFDMPPREAVDSPLISHQWFPDQITFEAPDRFPEAMKVLEKIGHKIVRSGPLPQGDAHTIWVAGPNQYVGVADRRISGKASGY